MEGKSLPMLYKKSSSGKIVEWTMQYSESSFWTVSGYSGMKMKVGSPTECTPKNVGKSNETSPEEQAELEAKSKWKKKLDEGYFETKEEAENETVLLPMLAHSYDKRSKDIEWPCLIQRKYDGIRCMAYTLNGKSLLMSRKSKLFPNLGHIKQDIELINSSYPGLVIDGELYSDELSFEDITGAVRRETIKNEQQRSDMHKIKLLVYDFYHPDNPDMGFKERFVSCRTVIKNIGSFSSIEFADTKVANNEKEVIGKMHEWIEEGYEGAMLRNITGPYALAKRSKDLQKMKLMQTDEFKIIGHNVGKGAHEGCVIWIMEDSKGKTFEATPKASLEQRKVWADEAESHYNEMWTIRYQELSKDGIPRFPVAIGGGPRTD